MIILLLLALTGTLPIAGLLLACALTENAARHDRQRRRRTRQFLKEAKNVAL